MTSTPDKKPWYQEPYVWFLIFFPSVAVVAGFYTMYLAFESDDGVVVEDYYKQGLAINERLEREQQAAHYELTAEIELKSAQNSIVLFLNSSDAYELPNKLQLNFLHRTQAGLDHKLMLNRIADDYYQAELPNLIAGSWYIELAAEDWRMLKPITLPHSSSIQIIPNT